MRDRAGCTSQDAGLGECHWGLGCPEKILSLCERAGSLRGVRLTFTAPAVRVAQASVVLRAQVLQFAVLPEPGLCRRAEPQKWAEPITAHLSPPTRHSVLSAAAKKVLSVSSHLCLPPWLGLASSLCTVLQAKCMG